MHAIRQKCRPKHQVLVLKCYPRTTKGAVDIKPNSSELSYLLYYTTTRRSKIQKVGSFLERKTASDVWRLRIGNVQVTLQIVEALIEKSPRDLPLYAPYVLKILNLILRSNDITMVEASIPTFESFCQHHDGASLSADQEYLKQYEDIIRMYASFGSTRPQSSKAQRSTPVAMRWRNAGLQAINSVAWAEGLGTIAGRQLDVIMPILLENIWTDNMAYLDVLQERVKMEEKVDAEKLLRRRTSIATVRTVETSETNPNMAALSGTTADADKLAEEDIGVLAMQGLKHIFAVDNRSQIRGAAYATMKFIEDRVSQREVLTDFSPATGEDRGWATTVILKLTRWTPVQDRYIILVTTMEKLVQSPLTEVNLPQQLILATMIGSLLSSDINLIGLSVMDVLLGLIQHILRILQLGGVDAHLQQRDITSEMSKETSPTASQVGPTLVEVAKSPSTPRKELLARLERCIADLATHVYYADQISDMIAAILLRLKPTPLTGPVTNVAAAIEDPETTTTVISQSVNWTEDSNTDGFFSFDTAKITALHAVKGILLVASKQAKMSGKASSGRSRVGLRVWEGTQWLLRDVDGGVRKAYAEALLTWLQEEMTKADLKAAEDKPPSPTKSTRSGDDALGGLTKRAVSNATQREKVIRPSKTTFLQLLHLAIYENALQYINSEADLALLHLLLVTLIKKLGVNAVRSGLPMIFRLQEDIQEVETVAKVRIGSLCHGYFWAMSEEFNFEASAISREIQSEIVRRRSKGFWADIIRLPPVPISQLGMPGVVTQPPQLPMHILESESLRPFDDRLALVELICLAYTESMASPPTSPPTSPGRSFSHPILGSIQSSELPEFHIPEKTKEQMLAEWSKEAVLARVQSASKTASLNGSRSGTNATRTFLTVNGGLTDGRQSGTESPHDHGHVHHRSRPPSQAYGLVGPLGPVQKLRKPFGPRESPFGTSVSSRASVTRVDQLKRVLSGQAPPSGIGVAHSDASSDSMVSYEVTPSELSFDHRGNLSVDATSRNVSSEFPRSKSRDRMPTSGEHLRPLSSNPVTATSATVAEGEESEDLEEVPPVPPVPSTLPLPGGYPSDTPPASGAAAGTNMAAQDYAAAGDTMRSGQTLKRDLSSRSKMNGVGNLGAWDGERDFNIGASVGQAEKPLDLETLLHGIEAESVISPGGPAAWKGIHGLGGTAGNVVVKPPY